MTDINNIQYDDTFMKILLENKTLINFLYSFFGFLQRKTDFYMILNENAPNSVGFPPGVAEELVIKIMRKFNPYYTDDEEITFKTCPNNEYVPNYVAEEVEIETTEFETPTESNNLNNAQQEQTENVECLEKLSLECNESNNFVASSNKNLSGNNSNICNEKYEPEPMRSEEIDKFNTAESQKDSESYNGAKRDKYKWSQKIGELDVTLPLPPNITSSKQVKVNITSNAFEIDYLIDGNWQLYIQDNFSHRIKTGETVWLMSEGKMRIHMEKQDERWWTSLLENEPKIDTTRIDCSRPLDELPEEHIAKVRELQWNQLQVLEGKPTSEQLQKQEILKKAWNMENSPFANTPFDPSVLH